MMKHYSGREILEEVENSMSFRGANVTAHTLEERTYSISSRI